MKEDEEGEEVDDEEQRAARGGWRRLEATGMTEEQTTKMKWRRLKLNFLTNGIKDEFNVSTSNS